MPLYIFVFWIGSLILLGAGHPAIERWWVPSLAILVSIGQMKNPIQIPSSHKPWFIGFCVWWIFLLVPFPTWVIGMLQGGLGDYRLLLMEQLNIGVSTIALRPSVHLYSGAMLFLLYILFLQIRTRRTEVDTSIANVVLIFCGFGILQYAMNVPMIYGIIPVPNELRSPFFASFINGNHAAYFMVCGIFLVHSVYKGTLQFGCQTLLLIGIYLCESRGAISVACVSLAWLYLPKYRLPTSIVTIVIGLIIVFTADIDSLTHGRSTMWIDSLQLFDWSWFLGIGFGGFSAAYPMIKSTPEYIQSSHLHMEYMEWMIHTGIFGLLLIGRFVWGLIKGCANLSHRNPWWGVIAVFICASLVDFPLQLNALALLFVVALGQTLSTAETVVTPNSGMQPLTIMSVLIGGITLIGPNLYSLLHPYPTNSSAIEQAAHRPLDPTVLEQLLWNKFQSIETDTNDSLEFSRDAIQEHHDTIESLHPVIVQHAQFYQSNIEAQRLLARWYRRVGSYNDACRIWQRVWSLETAVLADKRDWMKEGLACDPNLWMVLTTLPDDVELLLEAARILNSQKQTQATRFCLERAYELEVQPYNSSLQLTRWLIEQQEWERAWLIHRTMPLKSTPTHAEHCSHLKNSADLGLHFHISNTDTLYKELNTECGNKAYWTNRQWISGLKEGKVDAIEAVEKHLQQKPEAIVRFWELLTHAHTINNNVESACRWVEQAFHKDLAPPNEMVQSCAQQSLPARPSKWRLTSIEEIDLRLK